jgi:hypothetical protein
VVKENFPFDYVVIAAVLHALYCSPNITLTSFVPFGQIVPFIGGVDLSDISSTLNMLVKGILFS